MRLGTMDSGYALIPRIKLATVRRLGGVAIEEAAKSFLYRPRWGRPFAAILQSLLRGRSSWTVGERELFAAFVSRLNRCSYCVGAHGAVASKHVGDAAFQIALADWRTAPVRAEARAMLGFLEAMTLDPGTLGPTDAAALMAVGVDRRSALEGIYIGWWFNVGNRCADAFGLQQPPPESLPRAVRFLLLLGYRV